MYFYSDNTAPAAPEVLAAIAAANQGPARSYGDDEWSRRLDAAFSRYFDREVRVFAVATGTAANALALAACTPPWGEIFAGDDAHVLHDECGAVELQTGGARLTRLPARDGRLEAATLQQWLADHPVSLHTPQPAAVSITQATECGTVYSPAQVAAIGQVCRQHGLALHMDGARFANALVSLGTTPAQMTWKRGVDIVSFGGTKNGCWCAEAIVVMDPAKARDMPYIRKRSAQLFSKSRFIAAQFDAYLRDDLWLNTARHSNTMAQELAQVFQSSPNARLGWSPDANEVFPVIRKNVAARLEQAGVNFYSWNPPADLTLEADEELFRFVTSFATTKEDIATIRQLLD